MPTPILVTDIQVGDIIDIIHNTYEVNLSTGRRKNVTLTSRYAVLEIGKMGRRTADSPYRCRPVRVRSIKRGEITFDPNARNHRYNVRCRNWSDDFAPAMTYVLVHRPS